MAGRQCSDDELLPAHGADEGHKVLCPIQDQIKGFQDANLRLDATDDASTLGEGNEHGHSVQQFEVAVGTEVAEHPHKQRIGRWRRTQMVEGACNRVEGATLVLGDSAMVSVIESGAAGGVAVGAEIAIVGQGSTCYKRSKRRGRKEYQGAAEDGKKKAAGSHRRYHLADVTTEMPQ
ncbi:hypothetical protein BHM03_00058953 [Ensete ventricosum]|nr:hypothetical protein BHM03_00058953 [Ensete ventricosum]